MAFWMMLLIAAPGFCWAAYRIIKSRSTVGIGFLGALGLVLTMSFFLGASNGCEQAFCVNWQTGGTER